MSINPVGICCAFPSLIHGWFQFNIYYNTSIRHHTHTIHWSNNECYWVTELAMKYAQVIFLSRSDNLSLLKNPFFFHWTDWDLEVEVVSEEMLYLLGTLFFGFPHSLAEKFSIFCSLLLIFLLFLQSNMSALVLQDTWSGYMLTLGSFGTEVLSFV